MSRSLGDDDFEPLFRRLFLLAARLAYRIVGDRELAEDIGAEALRSGARPLETCGSTRASRGMDHASRVEPRSRRRAARRGPAPSQTDFPAPEVDDSVALRLALTTALRALPRRQREVIVLRFLVGLPDREVVDTLGNGEGTVRTHGRRPLAALRSRGVPGLEDAAQ